MTKTTTLIVILTLALIYQSKPIYKPIEKDSTLTGEWVIAGFGNADDKGRVLWGQCNACSHIIFYKNGQGVIKDADGYGSSTSIIWLLKTSKLSFKFTEKKQRGGVIKGNLNYISSYSIGKKDEQIILLDPKRNFEVLLARTIPH